ncbi:hypothetical protein Rs2_25215 [Raphanus sativus]|nr:hypothetical protein Rs2_25215 [Raphanus sativus]
MTEAERVTSIVPVSEFSEDQYLLMLCIKKVPSKLFSWIRSTRIIVIQVNSGDELKWVPFYSSDDLVAMASQKRNGSNTEHGHDDCHETQDAEHGHHTFISEERYGSEVRRNFGRFADDDRLAGKEDLFFCK